MSNATEETRESQTDTPDVRPNVRHATWCSPEAHAIACAESVAGYPVCVGRENYVQIAGRDLGGWWRQDKGGEPVFAVEWDLKFADLDPGTLLSLYKLFVAMSWQDVSNIATMLGTAIDEYEGGDAWRGQMPL